MNFLQRNRPTQIEEESSNNQNKRGNIPTTFHGPTSSRPQNRDKKDHNEQNLRIPADETRWKCFVWESIFWM